MRKKLTLFLSLCMVVMLCLTGCGTTGQQADDGVAETPASTPAGSGENAENSDSAGDSSVGTHINVALFTYIEGMDPAIDWCGWNLTRCGVGETLVTVNEDMEIVGQLADSWKQTDDLTYEFHIRRGVTFSNGNELTPEIVKASIERTIENNSRGESLKIADIAIDGENIIFTTTEPFSAFITNLTEPMCCIVDTTVDTSDYASMPICTGPYKITEYVSEERIELARYDEYWDGASQIETITCLNIGSDTKVDAILAGDIDIAQGPAATTLSQLEGNNGIEMISVTGTRENDAILNCAREPLSDLDVRLALSYATNRDVIAQIAGSGYATALDTAFPESVGYGYDDVEGQTYDLDKAVDLLREAGYTDTNGDGYVDINGENLSLTISLSNTSSTAVSEALQDMWGEAGIQVDIKMLENIKDIRASGDFDVIMAGWQTVNAGDGQKFLAARFGTGATDNYGQFSSEAFDDVLTRLDAAFDTQSRLESFVAAQQILIDECAVIWLYANDNVTIVNTNKVDNVTVFPIDYYLITNQLTVGG